MLNVIQGPGYYFHINTYINKYTYKTKSYWELSQGKSGRPDNIFKLTCMKFQSLSFALFYTKGSKTREFQNIEPSSQCV